MPLNDVTILVVDDDKNNREGLKMALERRFRVLLAEDAEHALELFRNGAPPDVLLSDVKMPGMGGMELLKLVKEKWPETICILLTAYGDIEQAVEAMKLGAENFLPKPINLDQLDVALQKAVKTVSMRRRLDWLEKRVAGTPEGLEGIVGSSPGMRRVFEIVRQVAQSDATVLIQGPSGTGKELVANAIHRLSRRADKPFVAVNCAALPPNLLESELFGHEKGAFTGAVAQRRGRFEQADGGTLFLDEISEIELPMQVKLLRALEERKFERVGGTQTVSTDIRVVAATNRNLKEYVAQGKFREDLYFRLDVVEVNLPPLRERGDDLPLLFRHFLDGFDKKYGRSVKMPTGPVLDALRRYTWPGNVRELRNTVERMVVLAQSDMLTMNDLPDSIRNPAPLPEDAPKSPPAELRRRISPETEKEMILSALEANRWNKTAAAEQLGITRRTILRKLKAWGLE